MTPSSIRYVAIHGLLHWISVLSRSHKGPAYQQQHWQLSDLWQKDENGNWGKNIGTFQGAVRQVRIASHQTKVWRAVSAPTKSPKEEL